YMQMVFAAARDADYAKAAELGRQAMAARIDMANFNPTLTTRVVGTSPEPTEPGGSPAWFPGEVNQYVNLAQLTNGAKGTLLKKLPLSWAYHRDPNDTGTARGWHYQDADLTYWNQHKDEYDLISL